MSDFNGSNAGGGIETVIVVIPKVSVSVKLDVEGSTDILLLKGCSGERNTLSSNEGSKKTFLILSGGRSHSSLPLVRLFSVSVFLSLGRSSSDEAAAGFGFA